MKKIFVITFILGWINVFSFSLPPIFIEYDMLYNDLKNYRTIGYKGIDIKSGKVFHDNPGFLLQTNSSLDIAIVEKGFFKVKDNLGNLLYSRNGSFTFNKEGYIVNSDNFLIQPEIKIELRNIKAIRIEKDHLIIEKVSEDNLAEVTAATFPISLFLPGETSSVDYDNNYFTFSEAVEYQNVQLYGGHLELSTVEIIPVLTRMFCLLSRIRNKSYLKNRFYNLEAKLKLVEKLLDFVLSKEQQYDKPALDSNRKEIDFLYNLTAFDPILPFLARDYR